MSENLKELSPEEILRLFEKLSDELARPGQSAIIYVVGGANIALMIDAARSTTDIDVVVKSGFKAVQAAASAVAETEPGLGSDWLNSEFTHDGNPTSGLAWQWFDKRDDDIAQTFFSSPNLTVQLATPEMMLALKTLAGRDQDVADAHKLMAITGLRTYEDLSRNIERFTGPRLFAAQGQPTTILNVQQSIKRILDNAPADLRPQRTSMRERLLRRWRNRAGG